MNRFLKFCVLVACWSLFVFAINAGPLPAISNVFVIVLENQNWSTIKGNASAPWINNYLLSRAAHCENYMNLIHPSEPNYVWMEAGNNVGITDDSDPGTNHKNTTNHLVSCLNAAGIQWHGWLDEMPVNPLVSSGKYAAKHFGPLFFDDVTGTNTSTFAYLTNHVRSYTEFTNSFLATNTVAGYNFIVPNLCNDGHDSSGCDLGNAIAQSDRFASNCITQITNSYAYSNGGAIFLCWDECASGTLPLGMIVVSPYIRASGYATWNLYTHSSFLRTMQDIFNVKPYIRDAAAANNLSELFNAESIIPSVNAPTAVWSTAGVPGGIPLGRAIFTNLDTTATAAQIQNAINVCPAQNVVLLANGTFNLTSGLTVLNHDNWTLRGAGMGQTILKFTTGAAIPPTIDIGQQTDAAHTTSTTGIVSAMQGSSNVVMVAANTNINVGSIVVLDELNESWMTPSGASGVNVNQMGKYSGQTNRLRMHWAKVYGKSNGTNLTIWPPLAFTFDTAMTPQISLVTIRGPTNSGFEDLTIDMSGVPYNSSNGKQNPMRLQAVHVFWMKNVEFKSWINWAALWVLKSSCLEMRGCFIHDPPIYPGVDWGYGMQIESTSGSLFTDNIHYNCQSTLIFQNGCDGNVLAYNVYAFGHYAKTNNAQGTEHGEWLQHEISGNHTPFPEYNLYEGNYTGQFQSDYFYGPSGWGTLFRNRIPGRSLATTKRYLAVSIDSFNRNYSVIGNALGEHTNLPSITLQLVGETNRVFANTGNLNWTYEGAGTDAFNWDTDPHIYRLGYPLSGNNTGSPHDAFVKTNTLRHGNWDAAHDGVVWDSLISDTNIPNSLFLSSVPSFFGTNFSWPPYGPTAPVNMVQDLQAVPAGWRLLYGTNLPYGQLMLNSNSLDFGFMGDYRRRPAGFPPSRSGQTNTIIITNTGNADFTLGWTNNALSNAHSLFWINLPGNASNVVAGATLNLPVRANHNAGPLSPPIGGTNYQLQLTGGGGAIINCFVTYDMSGDEILAGSGSGNGEGALKLSSQIIGSEDLIPFIAGQSQSAYVMLHLSDRSIVTLTASVQATNAGANQFAVELDGEPVYPYSVWDLTTTGDAFETQTLNLRGIGSATVPDQPANPWLLASGTHYIKLYSLTADTKLAGLTANVTPIISQTELIGGVVFGGAGGL